MDGSIRAKKTTITYSRVDKRKRVRGRDPGDTKRRRIEDDRPQPPPKPAPFTSMRAWLKSQSPSPSTPSTPEYSSRDTPVFSDNLQPCATPPSSPPIFGVDLLPADASDRVVLAPTTDNVVYSFENTHKEASAQLVQMQISLGSNLQRTCNECGMTYVRSNAEDFALHVKFHGRFLNGVDLGKPFRKWAESRAVWRGQGDTLAVVVDANDRAFERRKVAEVLELVQSELGAVEIPERDLWSTEEYHEGATMPAADSTRPRRSRYRAFLYMSGLKCVGLCLAKRITSGHTTIDSLRSDESVRIADETSHADVGISRVWTSKTYRQNGIAATLLDLVTKAFDSGCVVPKDRVAFSQPTTSGAILARRWFGQKFGWMVYID